MNSLSCWRCLNQIRLLGGLALLFNVSLALAADPLDVGLEELDREARKHREVWKKLYKGEVATSASDKSHTEAIDFQAKFDTWRFIHQRFHKVSAPSVSDTIDKLYRELDSDVDAVISSKNKELVRLFSKGVIDHSKEVLESPKAVPIAQINIARVLARTAALGQPELADTLVALVTDQGWNDGVKYWALRGLRDLLARTPLPPQREDKVARTLMAFIQRKVAFSPITPEDELEGIRVLRREAVRALAQIRNPGKAGKDRPALVLLRVMAGEGFPRQIAPRVDERMEAAIGLARMRPDKDKDYQPAYAVQQIALFLRDFAEEYSRTSPKDLKDSRRPTRVLAAQLSDALEALKTESMDKYVKDVFDANPRTSLKLLLERIVNDLSADPSPVVGFVEGTPPPEPRLFKSMPDSTAVPPKKAEPEPK